MSYRELRSLRAIGVGFFLSHCGGTKVEGVHSSTGGAGFVTAESGGHSATGGSLGSSGAGPASIGGAGNPPNPQAGGTGGSSNSGGTAGLGDGGSHAVASLGGGGAAGNAGTSHSAGAGGTRVTPPTTEQIGERLSISGGGVGLAFPGNVITGSSSTGPFRIAKFPVTRGQFDACVTAGGCEQSDICLTGQNAAASRLEPATCVIPKLARQYCAWVGGTVAKLEQWWFAAGPGPYPWGSDSATCDNYPLPVYWPCPEDPQSMEVGRHPAGASPLGMQDVLTAQAELVGGTAASPWGVCMGEGGLCLFQSQIDGAFRGVGPANPDFGGFAFRCAWAPN